MGDVNRRQQGALPGEILRFNLTSTKQMVKSLPGRIHRRRPQGGAHNRRSVRSAHYRRLELRRLLDPVVRMAGQQESIRNGKAVRLEMDKERAKGKPIGRPAVVDT